MKRTEQEAVFKNVIGISNFACATCLAIWLQFGIMALLFELMWWIVLQWGNLNCWIMMLEPALHVYLNTVIQPGKTSCDFTVYCAWLFSNAEGNDENYKISTTKLIGIRGQVLLHAWINFHISLNINFWTFYNIFTVKWIFIADHAIA